MLSAMIPRGPDDEGRARMATACGGSWQMGARRLAILDLSSAGHQPMHDPQSGNWVVHNGEIFNYRELRDELATAGFGFHSDTDTEVILHGYRHWGTSCFEKFEGMFGCAIWDAANQQMVLARGPHGIKPLYYFAGADFFLFASELRALLATGLIPRQIDPAGLDSFLKFGAVQEPVTMIRGIRMVPVGHYLRHTGDSAVVRPFVNFFADGHRVSQHALSPAAVREQVREALKRAVRLRMISDVPLGVFLSGGLDSGVIAALASQAAPNVRTFTVSFAEKQFAEGASARRTAQALGTDHCEMELSQQEFFRGLPAALQAMDQPTVDGVNTYFVSKLTKQAGVTVALSGLGGDEIFAGYRSFRQIPQMEWLEQSTPAMARRAAGSVLQILARASHTRKLAAWLQGENGYGHPYFLSRMLFFPSRVAQFVQPEWLAQVDFAAYADHARQLAREAAAKDPVNRVCCFELATYMRNMLLRDTDCMSMAHSLEVRVPFLDHQLTSLLLRIPGSWKVDGRRNKPLLADAADARLPKDVLTQRKRSFELPWRAWLRGELREEVGQWLREPGPVLGQAIQWDFVRNTWSDFLRGREHWSRPWLFYVLRKWTEQHLAA